MRNYIKDRKVENPHVIYFAKYISFKILNYN